MNALRFCLTAIVLMLAPVLAQAAGSQATTSPNPSHISGVASTLNLNEREQAWLAAHKVIRVGMDPDYAPYEWRGQDGLQVGMAVDYLRLLEKKLGVTFDIVKDHSWVEVVEMSKRGEVDLLTSIVKTPERSKFLIFTEPYRDIQTVIIDNGQSGFVGDLSHLAGKRVALEQGYFTQELLAKDHPQIHLVLAASTQEALKLVLENIADAYVGDIGTTNFSIMKYDLRSLRFSGQTEYLSQHRFAVPNTQPELALIINKAMSAISKEETDAIFSRWQGMRFEQGIKTGTLLKYAAAGTLLFLLIGYWVHRLRREVRSRKAAERRESARSQILEMLAKSAPLRDVLDRIVRSVEQENSGMICSILLLDSSGKHFAQTVAPGLPDFYNSAIEGIEIGMGVCSCGTAAFTGERIIVEDIASHPYCAGFKELAARAGLAACWSQPIRSSSDQILGTFAIYHRHAHLPDQSDISLIEKSASLASIAVEKNIAAEKLRDSASLFHLLTEDILDVIWKTDSHFCVTYISPADERVRGFKADEVIGHHVFEMFTQEGIEFVAGLIKQRAEREHGGAHTDTVTFEVQHRCKDGRLLWGEVFSTPERDHSGAITGYHGITRDVTKRKQMEEQVRQLAFYDALTNLPNRRLLIDRLSCAMAASKRGGYYAAVMFLDLDNFKPLNDMHGHVMGDLLLVEAANRLRICVREMDTVARFGGDEFVVMLSELAADKTEATAQAEFVAEKILSALSAPYVLTTSPDKKYAVTVRHRCTASIGIAVFIDHEGSEDDIIKWADDAMYQAKAAGRNQIRFYDMEIIK